MKTTMIRTMMFGFLFGACGSEGYDGTANVPRRDAVEWISNVICDRARDCGFNSPAIDGWCEWNLVESVCQHGLCSGTVEVGVQFDNCLEAWETWPCDRGPVPPVECREVLSAVPPRETVGALVFKPGKPIRPTDGE